MSAIEGGANEGKRKPKRPNPRRMAMKKAKK